MWPFIAAASETNAHTLSCVTRGTSSAATSYALPKGIWVTPILGCTGAWGRWWTEQTGECCRPSACSCPWHSAHPPAPSNFPFLEFPGYYCLLIFPYKILGPKEIIWLFLLGLALCRLPSEAWCFYNVKPPHPRIWYALPAVEIFGVSMHCFDVCFT